MIVFLVRSRLEICLQLLTEDDEQFQPLAVVPLTVRVTVPVYTTPCAEASDARLEFDDGSGTCGDTFGSRVPRMFGSPWQLPWAQMSSVPLVGTWLAMTSFLLRPNCGFGWLGS